MSRAHASAVLLLGLFAAAAPAEDRSPKPLCPASFDVEPAGYAELAPNPLPGETVGSVEMLFEYEPGFPLPFVRDTRYGARPSGGRMHSPTEGYNHYEHPSKHYGLWFRPSAASEDNGLHCRSRPFAPRGYGWANRRHGFEMDYHPYVVKQLPSVHGPSYYCREPLTACPCKLQGHRPTLDGQH